MINKRHKNSKDTPFLYGSFFFKNTSNYFATATKFLLITQILQEKTSSRINLARNPTRLSQTPYTKHYYLGAKKLKKSNLETLSKWNSKLKHTQKLYLNELQQKCTKMNYNSKVYTNTTSKIYISRQKKKDFPKH